MDFIRVSLVCLGFALVLTLAGCGSRKEGWSDARYDSLVEKCSNTQTQAGIAATTAKSACSCYYDYLAENYDWNEYQAGGIPFQKRDEAGRECVRKALN